MSSPMPISHSTLQNLKRTVCSLLPGEAVTNIEILPSNQTASTTTREVACHRLRRRSPPLLRTDNNNNDDGVSPKESVVDPTRSKQSVFRRRRLFHQTYQPSSLSCSHSIAKFAYRPEGGSCDCIADNVLFGGGVMVMKIVIWLLVTTLLKVERQRHNNLHIVSVLFFVMMMLLLFSSSAASKWWYRKSIWRTILPMQPMIWQSRLANFCSTCLLGLGSTANG